MGRSKLMKDWDFRGKSREKQRLRSKDLKAVGNIGDFMLRHVETRPGCLGLVVKIAPETTKNFLIEQTEDWSAYSVSGNSREFSTIPDLISHFAHHLDEPFPIRLTDVFGSDKKKKRKSKKNSMQSAAPPMFYGAPQPLPMYPPPMLDTDVMRIQQLTAQNTPEAKAAAQAHFELMRKQYQAQQTRVDALQAAIDHVKRGGDPNALNRILGSTGLLSESQQKMLDDQERNHSRRQQRLSRDDGDDGNDGEGLMIAKPGDSVSTVVQMRKKSSKKKKSKKAVDPELQIFSDAQERVRHAHMSEEDHARKKWERERVQMDEERKRLSTERSQFQLEMLQREMELQRKELESQRRIMEEERVTRMEEREQLLTMLDEERLKSEQARVETNISSHSKSSRTTGIASRFTVAPQHSGGPAFLRRTSANRTSHGLNSDNDDDDDDDYRGDSDGIPSAAYLDMPKWKAELERRRDKVRQQQEHRKKATEEHSQKLRDFELEGVLKAEREKHKREMDAKLNAIIEAEELRRREERERRKREEAAQKKKEEARMQRELEEREARAKEDMERERARIAREQELLQQIEEAQKREQELKEAKEAERERLLREERERLEQAEKQKLALQARIRKEREQRRKAEKLSLAQLESEKQALLQQQSTFENALKKLQQEAEQTKANAQRALQDVERRQRMIQQQHHQTRMQTYDNVNAGETADGKTSSSDDDEEEDDYDYDVANRTGLTNTHLKGKFDYGDTNIGDLSLNDDADAMSDFSAGEEEYGFGSTSPSTRQTPRASRISLPNVSAAKNKFEPASQEPLRLVKFKKPSTGGTTLNGSQSLSGRNAQCTFLGNCTCPDCR